MALKSNLITCEDEATIEKLNLTIPSTVADDNLNVNGEAVTCYNEILTCYGKIIKEFNELSAEFQRATKQVTGEKLISKFKKNSTNCANQATYVGRRKQELINLFEFSQLEKRIQDLETNG